MKPPFKITPLINNYVAQITKLLGQLGAVDMTLPDPKLRKGNHIRTIKSTLAIEGNTLTESQITAVLEGKRVLGTNREIREVRNAITLYQSMKHLKSNNHKDFLKSHKILMKGLIGSAGRYRATNVGIIAGKKLVHLAPKPIRVPELMEKLFNWMKTEKILHPLILSSIVHYEIEFIHPFEDGNGRMGRFWQGLILKEYDPFFQYTPVESLIERHQKLYYKSLKKSDKTGDSTPFIDFMLNMIKLCLEEMALDFRGTKQTNRDRLEMAKSYFKKATFTRQDYMTVFKNISAATASRDLKQGLAEGFLKKKGRQNQTRYQFK